MCTYGGQRLAGGVEFLSRLSELRLRRAQVRLDLVDALLQRQDRLLVLQSQQQPQHCIEF